MTPMEYTGVAAFCISAAGFAFMLFDRVYGAGSQQAAAEASMQRYVDEHIQKLRDDVYLKHDSSQDNIGTTIQAMKDALHRQEVENLKARADAAETYMRRDSFYAALNEVKDGLKDALTKIDRRLEGMEQKIDRAGA